MCGIVGYIGPKSVVPVIIEGLRRLEYRGYDSAGIAVGGNPAAPATLALRRAPGKLRNLEAVIAESPITGSFGIGHTRWATHGRPTEENAHPHRDGTGTLVVVHNGIVENYLSLKQSLIAKGHIFQSETDTEIIAHVIQDELETSGAPSQSASSIEVGSTTSDSNESQAVLTDHHTAPYAISLDEAVRRAVKRLTGAFAIGVLSAHSPNTLVAARMGPPRRHRHRRRRILPRLRRPRHPPPHPQYPLFARWRDRGSYAGWRPVDRL